MIERLVAGDAVVAGLAAAGLSAADPVGDPAAAWWLLQTRAGEPGTAGDPLVIAPILVALTTAVVALAVRPYPRLRPAVSVGGVLAYAVAVAALVARVFDGGTLTYQLSTWPAPVGISTVADPLAAFMLAIAAAVAVPALLFAVLVVDDYGQRLTFHPLYHFMLVGVSGAFLTGDLFNLFVWFEVMLMSSYVLVAFYSGPEHTRAALQYVVLNLVGSAVMLVAIGGLYATTGTLNMADMARRLAAPAEYGIASVGPVLGLSGILLAVFALKAGLVPFQFWVPAAYRAAPTAVTAVLAGVVKKVGVYAIVRLYFTVFAAAELSVSLPGLAGGPDLGVMALVGPALALMAAGSILLGGVAAVSRDQFQDVLSYSSIGQVGFIVLPLGVGATATSSVGPLAGVDGVAALGIVAALVYSLNHALAKSTLFLASGAVVAATDTDDLSRLGGLTERAPVLSIAVFVAGVALVGIPPIVGFFGKFLVFETAIRADAPLALAVALAGAILTIAYFTRAWERAFWGAPGEALRTDAGDAGDAGDGGAAGADESGDAGDSSDAADASDPAAPGDRGDPGDPGGGRTIPRSQVAVVAAGALLLLVAGIGFDPVVTAARAAADAALDTGAYVEAVDPSGIEAADGAGASGGAGGQGTGGGGHGGERIGGGHAPHVAGHAPGTDVADPAAGIDPSGEAADVFASGEVVER